MAEPFNKPFNEALDFFRQKVSLPSKTWRDLDRSAHDRGFVVAGATKDALVEDLRRAVDDAMAKGKTPAQFREEFENVVAKHGWTGWTGEDSEKGRAWRARIIYQTNLRTSYAAGRYKQMTDPDVLKMRPFWRYRHGFTRIPKQPRGAHVKLDGLTLRADDPFWDEHYPPNDWECSCGVEPISRRQLEKEGKSGPDETPPVEYVRRQDPVTGEWVRGPKDVGLGWNYTPGKSWAKGMVPPQLVKPLKPATLRSDGVDMSEARQEISKRADIGEPVVWRDPSGHAVTVSEDLFKTANGERLAEALKDPDEIWLGWYRGRDGAQLCRNYLRRDPQTNGIAMVQWSRHGWYGTTGVDKETLLDQRRGTLLYRRANDKPQRS